jgi:hypothetical protein
VAARDPADAIVALRSMRRRWRGLFAGLDEDGTAEALARRPGATGHSAVDHASHATESLTLLDRALEQVVVDDDPVLDPAVADARQRAWPGSDASVDEVIEDLARAAERMADRADRISSGDWTRRGAVDHGGEVDALTVLWDAVDTAVADLRAAETTIREVRGRIS